MSWIGGKKSLRELIVTLFPLYYERYIEVFGGGGWVLFHKNPGNDFEVYNDFNELLVNLYRCVRDNPQELETARDLAHDLAAMALEMHGTITGEHGVGLGKRGLMAEEHGEAWNVMGEIKRALDPKGILNPGKVVPDAEPV